MYQAVHVLRAIHVTPAVRAVHVVMMQVIPTVVGIKITTNVKYIKNRGFDRGFLWASYDSYPCKVNMSQPVS